LIQIKRHPASRVIKYSNFFRGAYACQGTGRLAVKHGIADAKRNIRSFAATFYTEEGDRDPVGEGSQKSAQFQQNNLKNTGT
jgi:catalase